MAERAPAAEGSLRAWPFLCIYSVLALIHVSDGMVNGVMSPYLQAIGYPVAEIGALVGVYALASLASRLPVGIVYRGQHARWLMALSAAALVGSSLLYLDPGAALAARLLNGLAFGAATTVNFAHFLSLTATQPASRTRGIAWFTALMAGGFSVGSFTGGLLADHFGYAAAFYVAVVGNTALGVLSVLSPTPPPAPRTAAPAGDGRATWRRALQFGVLDAPLLAFALNLISFLQSALLPLYALSVGLNLTAIGAIRASHAMANAVTRPFLTGPIGRLGTRRLGLIGMVGSVACVMLIPSLTSLAALVLLTLPMGLSRAAVFLTASLQAADSAERHGVPRGLASGLLNVGLDLGALLGPALGGLLAARLGVENALRVMPPAVLALYLLVLLPTLWRQRGAAPSGAPPSAS